MCEIQATTYYNCETFPQHIIRGAYIRCSAAEGRPYQELCVPSSGQLRDLPLSLDQEDTDVDGECPVCAGQSPCNSSDEE